MHPPPRRPRRLEHAAGGAAGCRRFRTRATSFAGDEWEFWKYESDAGGGIGLYRRQRRAGGRGRAGALVDSHSRSASSALRAVSRPHAGSRLRAAHDLGRRGRLLGRSHAPHGAGRRASVDRAASATIRRRRARHGALRGAARGLRHADPSPGTSRSRATSSATPAVTASPRPRRHTGPSRPRTRGLRKRAPACGRTRGGRLELAAQAEERGLVAVAGDELDGDGEAALGAAERQHHRRAGRSG